jgi:hypothetical protein
VLKQRFYALKQINLDTTNTASSLIRAAEANLTNTDNLRSIEVCLTVPAHPNLTAIGQLLAKKYRRLIIDF